MVTYPAHIVKAQIEAAVLKAKQDTARRCAEIVDSLTCEDCAHGLEPFSSGQNCLEQAASDIRREFHNIFREHVEALAKRKDPAAVSLGRKGGKVGGKAKVPKGFSKMDPARRSEIARAAAAKRWAKPKDNETEAE